MKKLLFLFLVILIFSNCSKQEFSSGESFIISGEFYPLDGRLCFRDVVSLQTFYNDLVEMSSTRDTSRFPDPESYLNYFSCAIGIKSALSRLRDESNNDLIEREDDYPENWLLDEYRMALLNEYYEITIGDSIYVYLSENQIYKVPYNDQESIEILRQTTKGDDMTTPSGLGSGVELISATKLLSSGTTRGGGMECWYNADAPITLVDCEQLSRGRFLLLKQTMLLNSIEGSPLPHPATWTVDWGDGTYDNYNVMLEYNAIHAYPNIGTYTSKVSYSYINCFGMEEYVENDPSLTMQIEIGAEGLCSRANRHKTKTYAEGIRKIKAELWRKSDPFEHHQVAKTTSYRWESTLFDSEMRWRKQKSYVKAEINYEFVDPVDCTITESGLETDWGTLSSSQRAAKTNPDNNARAILDGGVHSYHEIEANPNNLSLELVLNICN